MTKPISHVALSVGSLRSVLVFGVWFGAACLASETQEPNGVSAGRQGVVQIAYLELVTTEVDAVCQTYERLFGVEFGPPAVDLGNARTASLSSGGLIGVREPLRRTESPVVRPYLRVNDIDVALAKAAAAGARIALPPMELPGYGTCAIVIQGGVEHGLWQDRNEAR